MMIFWYWINITCFFQLLFYFVSFLLFYFVYEKQNKMGNCCSRSSDSSRVKNNLKKRNNNKKINHVVVLCLENRSFDQILGYRSCKPSPFKVDGIDHDGFCWKIDETTNKKIKVYPEPIAPYMGGDVIQNDYAANRYSIDSCPPMTGFVLANQNLVYDKFATENNSELTDSKYIMGYFPERSFPIIDFLADNYMVCDRWFCSVPSQTIPNRTFMVTGSSHGRLLNKTDTIKDLFRYKDLLFEGDTIFDRLNEKQVSWKVYFGDFPITLNLMHQHTSDNLKNYSKLEYFKEDVKNNTLPSFSFIEPHYKAVNQEKANNNTNYEQSLIEDIYETLVSNKELWKQTLFILTYDENGAHYDHVYPPPSLQPDDYRGHTFSSDDQYASVFDFNQYGCRVPAVLVSPWIDKGVTSTIYDHTSILKFLEENFGLDYLTERDKNSNSFVLRNKLRNDIPSLPFNNVPTEKLTSFDLKITSEVVEEIIELAILKKDVDESFYDVFRKD